MGFFIPDPGLHCGELAESGPSTRRIESLCRQTVDAPHQSLPDARLLADAPPDVPPVVLVVPPAIRDPVELVLALLVRRRRVLVHPVVLARVPQPRAQVRRALRLVLLVSVSPTVPATTGVGAAGSVARAAPMARAAARRPDVETPEGMVGRAATLVRMRALLVLSALPVVTVPAAIDPAVIVPPTAVPMAPVRAVHVLARPAAVARARIVAIGRSVRVVSSRIVARVPIVVIVPLPARVGGPGAVLARGEMVAAIGLHLVA